MTHLQPFICRRALASDHADIRYLYELCFPHWQRRDFNELQGDWRLYDAVTVICEAGSETLGFANAIRLGGDRIPFRYLDYVAVLPRARRSGVGSALLREICATTKEEGLSFVVAEVDRSNNEDANHGSAEARISLYNSFRAFSLGEDHKMPDLSTTDHRLWVPMELLLIPCGPKVRRAEYAYEAIVRVIDQEFNHIDPKLRYENSSKGE
jgi:ribosomal protein S18 acetylase RimI-like enzyme